MISHGDELGRTQLGNNNAYCHDGPRTWIDWEPDADARELLAYLRTLFRIRASHPALRLARFEDIEARMLWIDPIGSPVMDEAAVPRAFGFLLMGSRPLVALFNGEEASRSFVLPPRGPWRGLLPGKDGMFEGELSLEAHGVAIFEEVRGASD
jgi:pullulanase/glycogen debranching enzyme